MTSTALAAASIAFAVPATAHGAEAGYVPGELLVRFEPGTPASEVDSTLADSGAEVERRLPIVPGLREVDLPAGQAVPEAVDQLGDAPGVLYAEPNWRREAFTVPNDPLFSQQWSLLNTGQPIFGNSGTPGADIHATAAWGVEDGSSSVRVGVIDTGISLTHPDLVGNIWTNPGEVASNGIDDDGNGTVDDVHGYDFTSNDSDPSDTLDPDQGHGTAIAGIIGAVSNNGTGIAGINWDSSLMAIRAPLELSGELAAIKYARDNGARVINYSAGSNQYSPSELAAIQDAPNMTFVVAAGNDHKNIDGSPTYPCSYPDQNIICVGSTGQTDALSSFSDYGPVTVDLAAPGENILSTFPGGATSRELSEHFNDLPLGERWARGGKGKKWRLTRRLGRGFSVSDSPHGRYRNDTNTWIRSRPIDLSERRSCAIEFYAKLRTQRHHDFLILEASHDGVRHWRVMRRYSGSSSHTHYVQLPHVLAGDDSVFVRFRLKTDDKGRRNGAFLDDISVSCETAGDTYAYLSGTSFSAPEVTGAVALILAQHPGYTNADVRSKILSSVDPLPDLAGKVATGGRVDLAKAVSP